MYLFVCLFIYLFIYLLFSAYNKRIVDEIAKLDALETPENSKQLKVKAKQTNMKTNKQIQRLKELVMLNENLKTQETKFKQNCRRQIQDFKERIEKLKQEMWVYFYYLCSFACLFGCLLFVCICFVCLCLFFGLFICVCLLVCLLCYLCCLFVCLRFE
jgi:hypothetical protein